MSDFAFDSRDFVRRFRENYVNIYTQRARDPTLAGVTVYTPVERPLRTEDLPEGARAMLAEYAKAHPSTRIELVKYLRLENGKPVEAIEDETGLPEENELLSLSRTITLTTSDFSRAVTEIYVARCTPRPASGAR